MNSRVKINVGTTPEHLQLLEDVERVWSAVDKLEHVADTECQFSGALRAIASMLGGDGSMECAEVRFEHLKAGDLADLFNVLALSYESRMLNFGERYSVAFQAMETLKQRVPPQASESRT